MEEPRVMISGGCDLALNSKILLPLIFLSSRLPQTPPFFQAQLRSFLPSLREAAASQLYAKSSVFSKRTKLNSCGAVFWQCEVIPVSIRWSFQMCFVCLYFKTSSRFAFPQGNCHQKILITIA